MKRIPTVIWLSLSVFLSACSKTEYFDVFKYEFPDESRDEYLSVTEYGADPTGTGDSSPAIQAAIAKIYGGNADAVLYFPEGIYRFDSPCTLSIEKAKSSPLLLKIVGDSPEKTILECSNSKGAFAFDSKNRSCQIELEDLTIRASCPTVENGFSFTYPDGGNLHNRSFTATNVVMDSKDPSCRFQTAMNLYGQWRPLVKSCRFTSCQEFPSGVAVQVSGTYTPRVVGCSVSFFSTAIEYAAVNGEGGDFCNNVIFGTDVGIDCTSEGIEPHLNFDSNSFDCRSCGIHIDDRKFNYIRSNTFSNTLTGSKSYCDIRIESTLPKAATAGNHIISHNTFNPSDNVLRKMISIGKKVNGVFVTQNVFKGKGEILFLEEDTPNVVVEDNDETGMEE